jgi:hypothetical protein
VQETIGNSESYSLGWRPGGFVTKARVSRSIGLIGILLATVTCPALAGVAYDYTVAHSGPKDWQITSAVEVDGARQRVNFGEVTGYMASTAQSEYRTGAFALCSDGGANATYFYPNEKQMLEKHIVPGVMYQMKQQVEGDVIKGFTTTIEDPKVTVRDLGDGGIIDGMPTHKMEIHASFVNGVVVGAYKTSGKQEYVSEVWTTDRIDPSAAAFVTQQFFRNLMPIEITKLIDQHDPFSKRFVLHRVTTIRVPIKGEVVTSVTEETVKNYRAKAIAEDDFVAPTGYEPVKHAPVPNH